MIYWQPVISWRYFHIRICHRNSADKGQGICLEANLRVAAYYRVSTGRETQKQSLENQITFYTDHVRQNPYGNLIAVYEDNFSGLLIKRSAAIEILQKTENQENLDMCFIEDAYRAIIDKEFFVIV